MAPTQEPDIAVTVTVEALFPGAIADEVALRATLTELSRDDAERYVRLKSQTPEEWAQRLRETPDDDGYKALRERPILTFPGNRSLIVDPTFYSDNLMPPRCSTSPSSRR